MDIKSEIIAYQNQKIDDTTLNRFLNLIDQVNKNREKKQVLKALYNNVDLNSEQYQSILDHPSVAQVQELLRYAQKKARDHAYRSTQQIIVESEKISIPRAVGLTVLMIFLAAMAALLVPQLSELFL